MLGCYWATLNLTSIHSVSFSRDNVAYFLQKAADIIRHFFNPLNKYFTNPLVNSLTVIGSLSWAVIITYNLRLHLFFSGLPQRLKLLCPKHYNSLVLILETGIFENKFFISLLRNSVSCIVQQFLFLANRKSVFKGFGYGIHKSSNLFQSFWK